MVVWIPEPWAQVRGGSREPEGSPKGSRIPLGPPQVLSADASAWIQEAFFSAQGPQEEGIFLGGVLPEGEAGSKTQGPWGWTSCVQTRSL